MALHEFPEMEQRSDEWYAARCGVITASTVGNLIAPERPSPLEVGCADCESKPDEPCKSLRDGKPIKTVHTARTAVAAAQPARLVTATTDTARNLILTLAAERITGHVEDTPVTRDMIRGQEEEPFARDAYADANKVEVVELGFMTEDRFGFTLGCSPDGLVGTDGGIEIKSRRAKRHVEIVLEGGVPAANMAQIQCFLLVSGRKWCDYVDFSNGMHLFVHRVLPDPAWFHAITEAACAAEEAIQQTIADYTTACANLPATERIPELEPVNTELKLA